MPVRFSFMSACLMVAFSGLEAAEKVAVVKDRFEVVETKLTPIAKTLGKPGPRDWLANHREAGQTFAQ